MDEYLKENNIKGKDRTDVNCIVRDMMSIMIHSKSKLIEARG